MNVYNKWLVTSKYCLSNPLEKQKIDLFKNNNKPDFIKNITAFN